jgi:rhodanese-related sulfurtransferase
VDVPEIEVGAVPGRQAEGAPLVDVREPAEYDEVHARGARLVPLGEVLERVEELPTDRTVYVICRSGARSGRATEALRARGVDAVNVAGGTLAWVEAGLPVASGPEPG